jgi:DNA repair protein RecN (Recombination protein N)
VAKAWDEYCEKGIELTKARKNLARILEHKVMEELVELAMPHALFSIKFNQCEPGAQGIDQIEFLMSPNPGEPLLPVVKIASGGELSRIALALKTIFAELDGVGTLIFDEIDAGIGGKASQKVAEKLQKISLSQQVICVTHSPLIAALADCHLHLEKVIDGARTKTTIIHLDEKSRVDELARMLGGENTTAELRKHAEQMLKNKNMLKDLA